MKNKHETDSDGYYRLQRIYNEMKSYNNKITKNYGTLIEEVLMLTKKENLCAKQRNYLNIEQENLVKIEYSIIDKDR